jgi:hypothetical protein
MLVVFAPYDGILHSSQGARASGPLRGLLDLGVAYGGVNEQAFPKEQQRRLLGSGCNICSPFAGLDTCIVHSRRDFGACSTDMTESSHFF